MNITTTTCDRILPAKDLPCAHYLPVDTGEGGVCKLGIFFRCPEAIKAKAMRTSHSTIQDWLRCRRMCWYRDIKGLTLKPEYKSSALNMGSLWDILNDWIYEEAVIKSVHHDHVDYELDELKFRMVDKVREYIVKHHMNDYDVAKVRAVYKAHKDYIDPELDGYVGSQREFIYHHWDNDVGDVLVRGFYDRLYNNGFHECKFTSDEKYYNNVWSIRAQVGTYFLANENLEWCDMKIIQKPAQKVLQPTKSRAEEETPDEYERRIYNDIIRFPSKYFIGFDKERRWYGIRFYRKEFDLKEIQKRYGDILREMAEAQERGSYYHDERNCWMYNQMCDYYSVCTNGGYASEEKFEIRKRDITEEEEDG